MAIKIELYRTAAQAAGARALNERLRAHNLTEFLLGETPPPPDSDSGVIRNRFYLASEDDAIRGGFLLAGFPAEFGTGRKTTLLNAREPLSEALIDSKYSLLGLRLLKFMQAQGPHLYALGMGSEDRPFPRLLKSSGWRISQVPFLFHIIRSRRFLRELQMLQTSPARRIASRLATLTGTGTLASSILQLRGTTTRTNGFSIERITTWGLWVDDLWNRCRADLSFAVSRDLETVRALYPLEDRTAAYLVRQAGEQAAWIAVLKTQMRNHKYFGNLHIATLLDGVAPPDVRRTAIALVSRTLAREGVDLLVTNQSHAGWIAAFQAAGYLSGRSNYILALSRQLAADIAAEPGGFDKIHFTRGDSDGRIHL
jgi:hypothetical protein